MLSASTSPELIAAALRRGASAYLAKSVDPTRSAVDVAAGTGRERLEHERDRRRARQRGCEGAGIDRARGRDPAGARPGPLERGDRQGAVGHPADGEVPPDEHLSQARRQEPNPGDRGSPSNTGSSTAPCSETTTDSQVVTVPTDGGRSPEALQKWATTITMGGCEVCQDEPGVTVANAVRTNDRPLHGSR